MNFSCRLPHTCSALILSLLSACVYAQGTGNDEAAHAAALQQRADAREKERADILQTRQAIDARQKEAETACRQRFAVEDCLRNVRQNVREQELPLRQRELELNQQERQEKANERLRLIEQKTRDRAPTPLQATKRRALSPAAEGGRTEPVGAESADVKTSADIARVQAERAAQAQKRAAKIEQARQDKAQERRAHVKKSQQATQEKLTERAAKEPVQRAQPLPVPEVLSPPKD